MQRYTWLLFFYALLLTNGLFFPLWPNFNEWQEKGTITSITELNQPPSTIVMVKRNALIVVRVDEKQSYTISDLEVPNYKQLKVGDCLKLWVRDAKGGIVWENMRAVRRCS